MAAARVGTLNAATPDIDFEEIRLEEKVGHGSYGVVYKAIWRDRLVAVKEFGASAEQKAIETEVKQLSRVKHTNIIALFAISSYQQNTYLIMEYAEGGSLHNFLHGKVQPPYSHGHAISWARQCAEGVAYLHAMTPKPLIHRDLKPLNLLLTDKGRHLKICDFGTVADKSTMMTNNRGSAAWMAPEVFEGSKYTEKCDIFSWAIVLWEVLSRKQPFKEVDNTYSIMWKIHKGERPPLPINCPKCIKDLMTACWKTAPEDRPSMKYCVDVMNEIIKDYAGGDKPLEYTFVNQQIITKDSDDTVAAHYEVLDSNSLSLNASDLSMASTQLTPTNVRSTATSSTTNTSNSSTPTNVDNNALFQATQQAGMPQVSIVSINRWDAIPEEDTEIINDSFNLTSSAEATKRLETIRNGMIQMASTPMAELTLDVEANGFDLCRSESGSSSTHAKSDGKERLQVTDTKPVIMTTTDLTNNNINNINNNNNNNGQLLNTANDCLNVDDASDMDENDGTDQSLAEMLPPELQPELPIPTNAESQSIYRDHRHMATEYLRVDTNLYYAQDFKEKLIVQMDRAECEQKQELLRKMKNRDELQSLFNNLKQQLEKLPQSNNPELNNTGIVNPTNATGDTESDGWVVIAPSRSNT